LISYLLGILIDTSISYSSNSSNSLSVFDLLIISIGGLTSTLLPGTVLHSFLARSNDIPSTLVEASSSYKDGILIDRETKNAFDRMKQDALRYGYHIDIESGYRDYDYQEKIYNKLLEEKGFTYAITRIAEPGKSEHQTGLAVDFCIYKDGKCYIEHDVEDKIETKWIHQNSHRYGFILRYPEGKEDITKYSYEPWHLRYVGNIASSIYNNNLTLEEYKDKESIK
jgi:LAS superfamily LD-carboxypeptidase LdcB